MNLNSCAAPAPALKNLEAEPLILDIQGRRFAPDGLEGEGFAGRYKKERNGVLLFDEKGEPFVFIVGNSKNEYFFVSCTKHDDDIWYSYSTMSSDDCKLGLDALKYSEKHELAKRLVMLVRERNPIL